MNSIDKNQSDGNFENLSGKEAVAKIKELADKAHTCFFCTKIRSGESFATRPMAAEEVDDSGTFWFLSPSDSYKNTEIEQDPHVQLLFQGSAHSDFMSLYGTAEISKDRAKIEQLWDPMLKTWFTEGKDDPRITVIKFTPSQGYYWDTKHSQPVSFLKIAIGAIKGETMDDSIQGNINL